MKTGEMYTMALENPKAKFICLTEGPNKGKIYVTEPSGILREDISIGCNACIPSVSEDWELVREPVDFMTAINSGKNMRPVGHEDWNYPKEWLAKRVIKLEWVNGKWYIE